MAHEPQHPDNPYSPDLQEVERVPAKIWELLRRNEKFHRAVSKLQRLDTEARKERTIGQAWFAADGLVKTLKWHHEYAGHAFEWLVPDPWFEIRHEVIADGVDLAGKVRVPTKAKKIEAGRTPDPKHWQTFVAQGEFDAESSRNHAGCAPMVRGPRITFTVPSHPRLQGSKVDGIQEWRDYHASHGPFTLADSWRNTPPGFKRTFCYLWRQRDSREKNPLTSCRTDAPQEHETNFFKDWRLMEALGRAAKTGQLKGEDFALSFSFDDLADDYRVFAIPKSVRSRTEARRIAEWLIEQLAADLPVREPDVYGSALQWDVFLTVEDLMRDGAAFDEALQDSFDRIHLHGALDETGQPNQRKLWGQRGADWRNTYRVMNSPLSGDGLIQSIFPRDLVVG